VRAFSIRTLSSVPLTCACVVIPSITTKTQGKLVPVLQSGEYEETKSGAHVPPMNIILMWTAQLQKVVQATLQIF